LLALRLLPALSAPAAWALAAWLTASALLMPLGLLARRFARPPAADRLTWAGMLAMGLFSSRCVASLWREVLLLLAWIAECWVVVPPRQALLEPSAAAVPLLALAATTLGFFNARRRARVRTVEVALTGL